MAVRFTISVDIGALADGVVQVNSLLPGDLAEDLFAMSVHATWTIRNATAGMGPVEFGYVHDDYTATEVSECILSAVTDPNNLIQVERSRRFVRRVGSFRGFQTEEEINDGRLMKTKIKWTIHDGHDLGVWLQNQTGATIPGNPIVEVSGTIWGRWRV